MPETHRVNRLIAPSRDSHNNWNDKDPVILEGVLGFTKDRIFNGSLEYFIGDGVHKYSELPKYGGAPASTSSVANTLVLRDANGKIDTDSLSLPDATPTIKGVVKASTTKAGDNVVKADANGGLDGWKDAISDAIANPSAGLVKNSDGTLGVDFDQMPTTKFEALLKSLKMLIPLTTDKAFYVNQEHANASDNTEDIVVGGTAYNRGSEQYPFKTIQACINYVTQTYSVGTRRPTIRVVRGPQQLPYNENLRLPTYARTSGYITLQAADDTAPPTINNTGAISRTIEVSGETWVLRRLIINNTATDPNNGLSNFPSAIYCYGGSTTLNLFGCAISQEYDGAAPASDWVEPRTIEVEDGATFIFSVISGYQNSLSCVKGNANRAVMLQSSRKAKILFTSANTTDDGICYDIPCSGTVTVFAAAGSASSMEGAGGGLHRVAFSGSVTGNTYTITGGAYIAAPVGGFPATGTGSVETDTYCWYKQAS